MPRPFNHSAAEIARCLRDGSTPSDAALEWLRVGLLRVAPRHVGECLEWGGARFENGYGLLSVARRPVGAHRLTWLLANGSLPVGMNVLHRCDNPPCIRLDHLFLGTTADNMADKMAKGRHRAPRKLSEQDVADIHRSYAGTRGEQRTLARKYGVTQPNISSILLNKTWKPSCLTSGSCSITPTFMRLTSKVETSP